MLAWIGRQRRRAVQAWVAPCGQFARRLSAFTLILALPAMAAPQAQTGMGDSSEVWKLLAAAAIGALATAFVAGRSAVTRADLLAFENRMPEFIKLYSPWTSEGDTIKWRLDKLEGRVDSVSARTHEALNAAHTAVGVRELVTMLIQERREKQDES